MASRVLECFRVRRMNYVSHTQPSPEMILNSLSAVTDNAPPRGRGTILLVEDEAFLREVTCEILESAGYRVLKTRNATEAASAFYQYKTIVKLLLTDVVLPGQNGRDLANDLRSVCRELKVIFISGYPVVLMLATLLAISSRAWVCARKPAHAA